MPVKNEFHIIIEFLQRMMYNIYPAAHNIPRQRQITMDQLTFVTDHKEYFKIRLRNLRQKKDISAREMSLGLNQNESYINRIESGKTFPSMSAFFDICAYLKISPREFFSYEGNKESLPLVIEKHEPFTVKKPLENPS